MFGMFCGISKIVLIHSLISGGILELFGSLVGKHWSIPSKRSLFVNSTSFYSALIYTIMRPSCNIDILT